MGFASQVPQPKASIRLGGRMHAAYLRRFGARGPLADDVLVLTTQGRVSGKPRSTTVYHMDRDGRMYVVATFGGAGRLPDWYFNLVADAHVAVVVRGKRTARVARVLPADEEALLWPVLDAWYPLFVKYRAQTPGKIPVVELVPE